MDEGGGEDAHSGWILLIMIGCSPTVQAVLRISMSVSACLTPTAFNPRHE